jgi:serine/threonine-protein kinase
MSPMVTMGRRWGGPPRRATAPRSVEDRYRSLFVVGRGGMGSVEVALERGEDGIERLVALKRLLPESARDLRRKEMFLREARLAALLTHPNVVHAFAYGDLAGELFLAMEYVEGEPLSHVLEQASHETTRVAAALVAHVLAQVCGGLHAAHELKDADGHPLGVVHRDVSPQNVMIAYSGRVKVLDFGVAKFEMGGQHTRTGEVKGKMAYMSPEQALGEPLDRRSDLFSVGAVLFECLAGRPMWGTGTDVEIMRRLALEEPPRLADSVADAPAALSKLHARLVARDPARRPATALEVAHELRTFANSADPPANDVAVQAMMGHFFPDGSSDRRALLGQALAQAAPSTAELITRGIDLGAEPNRPTMTEPIIVQANATSVSRRSRVGLAGVALVALAVMGAAATHAARRKAPIDGVPAATAEKAAVTHSPTIVTAPPPTSPAPRSPVASAAATQPTSAPDASGLAAIGSPRRLPVTSTPRSRQRGPTKTAPTGSLRMPDVDPAPF